MAILLFSVFSAVYLCRPCFVHAAVKGDIFEWQMKDYDWIAREFSDIFEKNKEREGKVIGKTGDEIYQWQMRDYEWVQKEFGDTNIK